MLCRGALIVRAVTLPRLATTALLIFVACAAPPKAPSDLSDLNRYLFREWPDSDPTAMESGVSSLYSFLAPLATKGELNATIDERSWVPTALQSSDITGITWPSGQDPSKMLGAGVAWKSKFSIEDHARWQIQTNQVPAEPTASHYARTFPDTSNPDCFTDRSCTVLDTVNAVTRVNPLGSVSFTLFKSFRWVKLTNSGTGGWAFVSRSWIQNSANGSDASILQSATDDVWLSISSTETWRYQANYSQSTPSLGDETVEYILASGVDQNLQADDKAIQQLLAQ